MTESRQSPGQAPESVMTQKTMFREGFDLVVCCRGSVASADIGPCAEKAVSLGFTSYSQLCLTMPVAKQYRYQPAI